MAVGWGVAVGWGLAVAWGGWPWAHGPGHLFGALSGPRALTTACTASHSSPSAAAPREASANEPLPSSLYQPFLLLGLFKMVLGSLPCFTGLGAGKSYWSKWTL